MHGNAILRLNLRQSLEALLRQARREIRGALVGSGVQSAELAR
jgi:hypothetical protein